MAAPVVDDALFRDLWPVFSAEAKERLAEMGQLLERLERREDGAEADLEEFQRSAHNLKGSAATLGLTDIERIAHRIESAMEGVATRGVPPALAAAVVSALAAVEDALARGDAGGEPVVEAVEAVLERLGGGERGRPAALEDFPEAAELSAALEGALLRARDGEGELRREAAQGGVALVRSASAALRAAGADLLERVAVGFEAVGAGGEAAVRAMARLAGDILEVAALRPEAVPVARPRAASTPVTASGDRDRAERSVRVASSTLEALARRIDLLMFRQGRQIRRAWDLSAVGRTLDELAIRLEHEFGASRVAEEVQTLRMAVREADRLAQETVAEGEQTRADGAALRHDLRGLRTVPAGASLEPLQRTVRDVAGRVGKEVRLEVVGGDVRVDRLVLDALREPLVHLVRNAVDHGLEGGDVRESVGKPREGRVAVRVVARGTRVGVAVQDDGAGVDLARVRAKAVERGLVSAEAVAEMGDAEVTRLVFRPGFSTASAVTAVSGRGVGLDVVEDAVRRLGGSVALATSPGQGSTFTLDVPATIANATGALVRVGRDVVALPSEAVERLVSMSEVGHGTVGGRTMVEIDGAPVPVADLATLLGLEAGDRSRSRPCALIVRSGVERVALVVDSVVGHQELVVSPFASKTAKCPHVGGTALLDSGQVVVVLDARHLVARVTGQSAAAPARRRRIVVADDSLTTRTAMKNLLEMAGYAVVGAADGEEALDLVQTGADLVVSDVQMPRCSGFDLVRRMKADPRLGRIPVILVTSLDSEEDRLAGLRAGASGYVVKREVERGRLLDLVRQLLPAEAGQ